MDSASLNYLTPLLDGIDKWAELAPLLPLLIALELILSADNAVALASISRSLGKIELQRTALNIGILISLVLRIILLLTANLIIKYNFIKLIASVYLFALVIRYFTANNKEISEKETNYGKTDSLPKVIIILAITDLAFSIDSVTAAVAISDQLLLVVTGTIVGVIALRFTADLFIKWLELFTNLEAAGYLAVAIIAVKLIIQSTMINIQIDELYYYLALICIFTWGFTKKRNQEIDQ